MLVCIVILLESCVLNSSQLEALKRIYQNANSDENIFAWSLKYRDYNAVVYAIENNSKTLFANRDGDLVIFDGWTITAVKGMGKYRLDLKIVDELSERTFISSGLSFSKHYCNSWMKTDFQDTLSWLQNCTFIAKYQNMILVNEDGTISGISQIVDTKHSPLKLTKLEH